MLDPLAHDMSGWIRPSMSSSTSTGAELGEVSHLAESSNRLILVGQIVPGLLDPLRPSEMRCAVVTPSTIASTVSPTFRISTGA
jgi:hypothetical protein